MTSVGAEIEALEREGWEALRAGDGARFYHDVMAGDGLMVFPGSVMDRTQALEAIGNAPPWATFELSNVCVIEATPDSAIVTYQAKAQRAGEPEYRALMSTAYAHRNGRWQLILHQQTPE